MAKARRDRGKNRANPIAKQVKPPTDPELVAIRDQRILPIIANLTAADISRRSEAALAIANLVEDAKCRKLLLREQLVRILLEQTITDANIQSKSAGWGILRNLALEEEADFCVHLYRLDILTALQNVEQFILSTVESTARPFSKLPKAEQEIVWELSISIISLISSLGEAQDEILGALTPLIEFVFRICSREVPDAVVDEALLCLSVLTEDNPKLADIIVQKPDYYEPIVASTKRGGLQAVAACGTLHNMYTALEWFDHNTPKAGASDAALVPVILECMDTAAIAAGSDSLENANPDQILQMALDIVAAMATSLQEALEHGSHHEEEFKGFDDTEEKDGDEDTAMDEDDSDENGDDVDNDSDEMDDDEMQDDMARVTGQDDGDDAAADSPTLHLLIRKATPIVLKFARPPSSMSESNEETHSKALSVLNNIAWTVSSIDFSNDENSSIRDVWRPVAHQIWAEVIHPVLESNTADISLATLITSLAWGLARSVQGQVGLKGSEHEKFMALFQASKSLPESNDPGDAFQGLGVKCIGVLGQLALDPAPLAVNRSIGVFFMTVLASAEEAMAAVVVETLDQIFDIYADKSFPCDQVFQSDGFLSRLEDSQPNLRKLTKSIDKRKLPELRARLDDALLNLSRFLKYKKREYSS